ncbi:hypothetical protein [Sulfobacillus thermosulfidooxidans]|nr:hypothetical protein [Sulfobacillus thermosulfidooxidans]
MGTRIIGFGMIFAAHDVARWAILPGIMPASPFLADTTPLWVNP